MTNFTLGCKHKRLEARKSGTIEAMKHKKQGPANPILPLKEEYCYVGEKKKRKYKTKLDAEFYAPVKSLQQYQCEYCGLWHNGNSSIT